MSLENGATAFIKQLEIHRGDCAVTTISPGTQVLGVLECTRFDPLSQTYKRDIQTMLQGRITRITYEGIRFEDEMKPGRKEIPLEAAVRGQYGDLRLQFISPESPK